MLTLVTYAANTGVLPNNPSNNPLIPANEVWSMDDAPGQPSNTGSTTAFLTPGGILHISDPDVFIPEVTNGNRLVYARYDDLKSTDYAIFEINSRIISTGDSYGVGFGFTDTKKSLEVALQPHRFGVYLNQGFKDTTFDTTDKFHTYRIVKNREVNMEVWADGILKLDIPYDQLAVRTVLLH